MKKIQIEKIKKKLGIIKSTKPIELDINKLIDRIKINVSDMLDTYKMNMSALITYDRKTLKKNTKHIEKINKESKNLKDELYKTIQKLDEEEINSSVHYVQILDYLREASHSLSYIGQPSLTHVENKHKELSKNQIKDLQKLVQTYCPIHEATQDMIMKEQFDDVDYMKEQLDHLFDIVEEIKKTQINRIKKKKDSIKASVLFINILQENKLLAINIINLLKSYRDFRESNKNFEKNYSDLFLYGIKVFENKKNFFKWLNLPNTALGGLKPLELIEIPNGVSKVKDIIGRIEHRIYN